MEDSELVQRVRELTALAIEMKVALSEQQDRISVLEGRASMMSAVLNAHSANLRKTADQLHI